ncbi:MAG: hypothetical protein ACREBR_04240, partial [bacterium]
NNFCKAVYRVNKHSISPYDEHTLIDKIFGNILDPDYDVEKKIFRNKPLEERNTLQQAQWTILQGFHDHRRATEDARRLRRMKGSEATEKSSEKKDNKSSKKRKIQFKGSQRARIPNEIWRTLTKEQKNLWCKSQETPESGQKKFSRKTRRVKQEENTEDVHNWPVLPDNESEVETPKFKSRRVVSFNGRDSCDSSDPGESSSSEEDNKKTILKPSLKKGTKKKATRRVRRARYGEPQPNEDILIVDSGCDQTLIGQGWKILAHTGPEIIIDGARGWMNSRKFPVVTAATVIQREGGHPPVVIIVRNAMYDNEKGENESLLHPNQVRAYGGIVDDLPSIFNHDNGTPGKQFVKIGDIILNLIFDGFKCFLP